MMNLSFKYQKHYWLFALVCWSVILRGQSPGGVTGATLWLKANAGTSSTTEGGAITSWLDQSGNSNNATTTTNSGFTAPISAGATFRSATGGNGMNFNPTVDFSSTNSLDGTGGLSTRSVFFVFNLRATSSIVAVVGYDDATPGGTGGNGQGYARFNGTNMAHGAKNNLAGNNYMGATLGYTISDVTPTIFDGQHVSNTSVNLLLNGIGTSTITTVGIAPSPYIGSYRLGATSDNQFQYGSILPEVISFNAVLTASERLRVSSYLAVKWGITLGTTSSLSDYLNSAGTTIWTGNATYQNNVAGIARDDASGLNQKQSKSVNTGLQVVMGNGNTIAADNASNSNAFSADKSALIWGDNAGSVSAWTTTGAPTNRQIVARTWKVQETGTVGSVKVQVADNSISGLPAEVTTVYLLVDADGNFASGATEVAMTLNGSNWEGNVDFTTGQFFTFATQVPPAPGGVAGSSIWLKANTGVTTGATFTWADQSGNGRDGSQSTVANQPSLTTSSINYNPALNFNGTTDRLVLSNLTGLPTGTATVEAFAVARNLNTAGGWMHIISYGGSAANTFFTLGKQTATANAVTAFNTSDAISSALEYANNLPALTNGKYTGTQGIILSSGVQRGTITFTANKQITAGRIGCDPVDASFWNGDIAEAVIFPSNLSTANVLKVNSYLAIKYGITLDQTTATNYVASDWNGTTGTIFWNGTTNSGYKNNITGISRDDASALNQKQSKSVNTGLQVVMGNGNTIATDNASNTTTFSADKSALIWGDDAASVAAWTTTGAPPSRQIVARKWKVQETGTVGYVKVQVPDNSGTNGLPAETNTVYLLVDADGNFASGATEYAMTLNGTNWEAPVDFTTGQFFTFATQENSPVTLNLAMTADKTTVSSGQNITYTLTLTNSGTNTATNVQVKDKLPAGVNFVSATPSSGTYNSTTGIWTLPSVAGAAAPTLTIVVTAQ